MKRDSFTNLDKDQEEHATVKVKSHKRDSTDLDDGFFDSAVKPMDSSATDPNDDIFGDADVNSGSLSVSSGRTYSISPARSHSFVSSIHRDSEPMLDTFYLSMKISISTIVMAMAMHFK